MTAQHLIHPPRLWVPDRSRHRRVTWMELFFDLIFVAAVAEVSAPLAHDYSPAGLVRYVFLFVLIWWAWNGHTVYTTRFDHDDLPQRLLVLLQCFIAAIMAANAREALDSRSSAGFGAAYAGMRIVLVIQYLRARRLPETRDLTTRYAAGFAAAAVLWIASAFLDVPARYWLWTAALAVDFATPWLASKHTMRFPPDATHFPERFGLFTIILLGEFIIAVMHGIESQEYWSLPAATTAFSSMAFAFVVRWWYFDVARAAEERHVRNRRQEARFQVWQYAHLPLFLGIAVVGVGFERLISPEGEHPLAPAEGWILCSAAALLGIALTAIGATSELPRRRVAGQVAIAMAALGLAAVAADLNRVLVVIPLLALCCGQTLLGRVSQGTRGDFVRSIDLDGASMEWRECQARTATKRRSCSS